MKRSFDTMAMQVDGPPAPGAFVFKKRKAANPLGPKLSKRQRADVRRILAENEELKYFLTNLSFAAIGNNTNGSTRMDAISQPTQGQTDQTRVGDRLKLCGYVDLRATVKLPTTGDAHNRVRLIMFQWKPNSTPTAAGTGILLSGPTGTADLWSQYSHDNRQLMTVIFDHTFNLSGQGGAATSPVGSTTSQTIVKRIKLKGLKSAPHTPFDKEFQYAAAGTGGTGTYTLNQAINVANTTALTLHGNINFDNPSPMSTGVGPLGRIYVFDAVPQAAVANNIVASQTAAGAGALTLSAGTSTKSVVRTDGTTVIQLDMPRAVRVNCSTTARAFTVTGYDYYGQPMSELITVAVAGTAVSGKKAFFQISSVTIAGSATVCLVGTTDVLGLPVRVTNVAYVASVKSNNTLAQDAGTFVAADTAAATTITGDVRGTYTPATASDGIVRTVMGILLPAISVGPNATRTGALGGNQNLVA